MLESVERYEADNGLPLADGLRELFVSGEVSPEWIEQLRGAPGPDPWTLGFAVIHRDDARVIGSAGFKGPPGEDGVVAVVRREVGLGGRPVLDDDLAMLAVVEGHAPAVDMVRGAPAAGGEATQREVGGCG